MANSLSEFPLFHVSHRVLRMEGLLRQNVRSYMQFTKVSFRLCDKTLEMLSLYSPALPKVHRSPVSPTRGFYGSRERKKQKQMPASDTCLNCQFRIHKLLFIATDWLTCFVFLLRCGT